MNVTRVNQTHVTEARGIVIAIDVIRAFSVACYACAGGARGIWLVRAPEEAQALRSLDSQALLIGEVRGRLIPGFDLNNSPSRMATTNVLDRQLIQRTGAGTQGAVNAQGASTILLSALTNAQATAIYARRLAEQSGEPITILPTATIDETTPRNEDDICADYIEALIQGQPDADTILQEGLTYLHSIDRFKVWQMQDDDFPLADIGAILALNRFPFAIVGTRQSWQQISYVAASCVELD